MPEHNLILNYLEKIQTHISSEKYSSIINKYHDLLTQFELKLVEDMDDLAKVQALLDFYYLEQIFSLPSKSEQLLAYDISRLFDTHSGSEFLLGFLLIDLCNQFDIEACAIYENQKILVKIRLASGEYIFINPDCGTSLDWEEVISFIGQDHDFTSPEDCEGFTQEDLIVSLISLRKSELIDNGQYLEAFNYIEILLAEDPDNPYERRDRGFILQQLECDKFAKADFEFFIEKCPQDPVAGLLKLQIENMLNTYQAEH